MHQSVYHTKERTRQYWRHSTASLYRWGWWWNIKPAACFRVKDPFRYRCNQLHCSRCVGERRYPHAVGGDTAPRHYSEECSENASCRDSKGGWVGFAREVFEWRRISKSAWDDGLVYPQVKIQVAKWGAFVLHSMSKLNVN